MILGPPHSLRRVGLLLAVAVALIAGVVLLAANVERSAVSLGARQQDASLSMRSAMFDLDDGARGFLQSHDRNFLKRWIDGTADFTARAAELRSLVAGDPALQHGLAEQTRVAATWHAATAAAILSMERTGHSQPYVGVEQSRKLIDSFRTANTAFDLSLSKANTRRLAVATIDAMAMVAALATVLIAAGLMMARRMARREATRHREHAELRELLQSSDSEHEAHTFLIGHLQRLAATADVSVLHPHDDRLRVTTVSPADPRSARAATDQLHPRSCMAVRLGRAHDRRRTEQTLLQCEICGAMSETSICEPLLVGGESIGSVLVASKRPIPADLRERVRETVAQAAPILANQRNLALATTLARSDALTGLSNRRAADETLERLFAQAARSSGPLAVVLLDLDSLKRLNDHHGHASGDHALALLGHIINAATRVTDFAARIGGDEFVMILPDTDRDGAITIADKLRAEIESAQLDAIGSISASLGLAMFPADASDAEDLLRKADRALYAAKKQGRNCIGVYEPSADEPHDRRAPAHHAGHSPFQHVQDRQGTEQPDRTAPRYTTSR